MRPGTYIIARRTSKTGARGPVFWPAAANFNLVALGSLGLRALEMTDIDPNPHALLSASASSAAATATATATAFAAVKAGHMAER